MGTGGRRGGSKRSSKKKREKNRIHFICLDLQISIWNWTWCTSGRKVHGARNIKGAAGEKNKQNLSKRNLQTERDDSSPSVVKRLQ